MKERIKGLKINNKKYYITYSIIFVLMMLIILNPFFEENKNLIWKNDGMYQHYSTLIYFSKWMKTLLSKGTAPLIDFQVGFGYDIISVLSCLGFGDPLNLIAVFFDIEHMETAYNLLIIIRYYIAGISFSLYCFYMNKDYSSTLLGAFTYIFCGFCLFAGVRHPVFLNPVIYFPLLLIGVERIISNKKPWLFSVFLMIAALSDWYFLYMLTITCFIYGFLRTLALHKGNFKFCCQVLIRAILWFVLGVSSAAALLLPAIYGFMDSTRTDIAIFYKNGPLTYPSNYYTKLFFDFFSPLADGAGYWTFLNYGSLATIAVLLLLLSRDKKMLWLKQIFLIFLLMLCIPWFGHVMNGFNYVINRWVWAFSFIISYNLVCQYNSITHISGRFLLLTTAIFSCLFFIYCIYTKTIKIEQIIGFSSIFLGFLLLLLCKYQVIPEKRQKISILFFALCGILISANYKFSVDRKDYIKEFRPFEKAYDSIKGLPEYSVNNINDSSFFRISNDETAKVHNCGMILGYSSLTSYFGISPDNVYRYLLDAEIPGIVMPFRYMGLDQRNALENLLSVKYFSVQEGKKSIIPTNYQKKATYFNPYSGKNDIIYENKDSLPLGYTYSSSVNFEAYKDLNPIRKEQLMLQAVILEDSDGTPEAYEFSDEIVRYRITEAENIDWNNGFIKIKKANSILNLNYTVPKGNNIYIRIKGLDINGNSGSGVDITCISNGVEKKIHPKTHEYSWYIDRENYTMNFGISDGTPQMCNISFPKKGTYKLENIEIYSVPAWQYTTYTNKLKEESLENIHIGTNIVTGKISISDKKYLCFSIPYGKGWKAYVDGQERELQKANIMYMALPLEAGEHDIRLQYCSPGLKIGAIISIISFLLLLFIIYTDYKHTDKSSEI